VGKSKFSSLVPIASIIKKKTVHVPSIKCKKKPICAAPLLALAHISTPLLSTCGKREKKSNHELNLGCTPARLSSPSMGKAKKKQPRRKFGQNTSNPVGKSQKTKYITKKI
jgi:hypothetical protein